jgi:secreted Zn-dependent insulinase-like peptidase
MANVNYSSRVLVSLQFGPRSVSNTAACAVLAEVMRGPAYNSLRTRAQLGYEVNVCTCSHGGAVGLSVVVAGRSGPSKVGEAVEAFLVDFGRSLTKMPKREYLEHRASAAMDSVRSAPRTAAVFSSDIVPKYSKWKAINSLIM